MAGVNSPGPKGSAAKGAGNILGTIGTAWTIAQLGGDLFGRRKLKKGYRQIAPGIWSKVFQDTVSLNPDGYQFYAHHTYPRRDTNPATITDTNSKYVASPVWIASDILTQIGGVTSGNICTSGFGSFIQAQTDLDALVSGDWEVIFRTLGPTNPDECLARLSEQSPVAFWCGNDGKWRAAVYNRTPSTASKFTDADGNVYYWSYGTDMLAGSFRCGVTPVRDVVNEVRIEYALFAPTNSFTKTTWVSPVSSDDGTGSADQTGAIGTATDRTARAVNSRDDFGIKQARTFQFDQIWTDEQAKYMRNQYFDMAWRPRIYGQFDTWNIAATLEVNQTIYINDDVGDYVPVPNYPGNSLGPRSWADIPMIVTSVERSIMGDFEKYTVSWEEIA